MSSKIGLALSLICMATASQGMDRKTVEAAKACHDYVWDVPAFKDLPNAAISVYPGSINGNAIVINWNVNWDEPTVQAAGNCTVIDGKVEGFEDYTKN